MKILLLLVTLMLYMTPVWSLTNNRLVATAEEFSHVIDTELILVKTQMVAYAEVPGIKHIKITSGYDVHCPGYVDKYRHGRSDSKDISSPFSVDVMTMIISNNTDGKSNKNGYGMTQAWAAMPGRISGIRCQLDYKGVAGFSGNVINLGLSSMGFTITGSYGANVDHKAETKNESIYMKPILYTGGGGGGDRDTHDYSCAVQDANCGDSPLIIDLAQDGIELGEAGTGVVFDINNVGELTPIQWLKVNGDEAFLARDLNGNGVIDDGSELFGTGTILLEQTIDGVNDPVKIGAEPMVERAVNGFVALAQYDSLYLGGNNDGYISAADAIWSQLLLWRDSNADAQTTASELMSLDEVGITHLETIPKQCDFIDIAGNYVPLWSWAIDEDHDQRFEMVDVFFKRLND